MIISSVLSEIGAAKLMTVNHLRDGNRRKHGPQHIVYHTPDDEDAVGFGIILGAADPSLEPFNQRIVPLFQKSIPAPQRIQHEFGMALVRSPPFRHGITYTPIHFDPQQPPLLAELLRHGHYGGPWEPWHCWHIKNMFNQFSGDLVQPTRTDAGAMWALQVSDEEFLSAKVPYLYRKHLDGSEGFELNLNDYVGCEKRKGLASLGGRARVDEHFQNLSLQLSDGTWVGAGDPQYEVEALRLRSTVLTYNFVLVHAAVIHLLWAQTLAEATYLYLPPGSSLRMLLEVFHFGSIAINWKAITTLVPKGGLVHRAFGFTNQGAKEAFRLILADERWKHYMPFDEWLDMFCPVPGNFKSQSLHFYENALLFVRGSLAMVAITPQDQEWWDHWHTKLTFPPEMAVLTLDLLCPFVATAITMVTVMHSQVGASYEDFFMWPHKYASRWLSDSSSASLDACLEGTAVAAVTGIPALLFTAQWPQVYSNERMRQQALKFQLEIYRSMQHDSTRVGHLHPCDLRYLEVSVAK